jgi:hypothetical protein
MSGKAPIVGLGGGAGIALLPDTAGSNVLFWVAVAALAIGFVSMSVSGIIALSQRSSR